MAPEVRACARQRNPMLPEPLVTHLCHVGMNVPDPEAAAEFYQRVLGLGVTGRVAAAKGIFLSTLPHGAAVVAHHEVLLTRGKPGIDHLAFGVPDERALQATAEWLHREGVRVDRPREFHEGAGPAVRFMDPAGQVVEIIVPRPPVRRPPCRPGGDLVKLGHVTQKSPDPPRQAVWWQQVMKFRLSDQMGENFYWLRCSRDHHSVAFVRAAGAGTHHIALEVASWEEIRRLGDHFVQHGVRFEFGPGRHGPGNNIFVYVLAPGASAGRSSAR